MKKSFVVSDEKVKDTLVLWISKVPLLFSLRRHTDRSERCYALLQFMCCTKPLDTIYTELGCVCLKRGPEDEIVCSVKEDDVRKFSIGDWFGLESSRTIRVIVHVAKINYSVKAFFNASMWRYHCFYINRFFKHKKCPGILTW